MRFSLELSLLAAAVLSVRSFLPSSVVQRPWVSYIARSELQLQAKQKRRRKRKKAISAPAPATVESTTAEDVTQATTKSVLGSSTEVVTEDVTPETDATTTAPPVRESSVEVTTPSVLETSVEVPTAKVEEAQPPDPVAPPKPKSAMPKELQDVVDFKFDPDAKLEFNAEDLKSFQSDGTETDNDILKDAASLPDMKDLKKTQELEKALAKLEEEKQANKPKIKRSDIKAFTKLLETNPYIDADDSFFEEEEYGVIEALLGERAKPFLGIPSGPLQVGHFIGALGIALMAFVEYPGFPLTNLPTPLRNCFQGGLGTIYAINTVLAILAFFKANERGLPPLLWMAKTFTVGGLALDQLTQLPTLEQQEKVKNQKGARALKNRKR